jgi:integrase
MKAYGNWLRYLEQTGQLKDVFTVGGRLTTEILKGYIAALRVRVSARTAVTQLRSLSQAVLALDPDTDRELLKLVISRLERIAPTSRTKSESLRSPTEIVGLGEHLMNLAQMRVGQHLMREARRWRVMFEPEEMKGARALAFDFPEELSQALDTYLTTIHPMLCDGPQAGAPLWPSLQKSKRQLTEHGIYTRITEITSAHFARPVTPHMFRDAAATFIAEMTPERARMAAAVLQHRSFETTHRHYIHGQQHLAAKRYHQAIAELVARVDNKPSR